MFRAVLRGLLVVPSDVRPLGEPWRGDTAARVQESSCVAPRPSPGLCGRPRWRDSSPDAG